MCPSIPASIAVALGTFVPAAAAQCEVARVADPVPHSNSGFGQAIDLKNGLLVIGDLTDDEGAANAGAAYVYRVKEGEPVLVAKLLAPLPQAVAGFGSAVATDGERVVVAAYEEDLPEVNGGAVYVFEPDGGSWACTERLVASDAMAHDRFGYTLAIEERTIVVGMYNPILTRGGAAYVFDEDRSGWAEVDRLVPPGTGPTLGNYAQDALALSGHALAVGAWGEDASEPGQGAVHVFRRRGRGWAYEARVLAPDGGAGDHFGAAADLQGDLLVVGAALHDAVLDDDGAAYVYRCHRGHWRLEQKLTAPDPDPVFFFFGSSNFGQGVSLDGDSLAVGAPAEGEFAGAVYLHRQVAGRWRLAGKVEDSEPTGFHFLGIAVASDRGLVVTQRSGTAVREARLFRASYAPYGPDSGVPVLYGKGCPQLGMELALQLSGGVPDSGALLFLGEHELQLPTPFGVLLLFPQAVRFLRLDDRGEGGLVHSVTDPALVGLVFHAQALARHTATAKLRLTGAIEFELRPASARPGAANRARLGRGD